MSVSQTCVPQGEGAKIQVAPDTSQDTTDGESIMLLEPRPFRPFKSSEEYLYAMKEDLAEWLNNLYNLDINVDNFFERLETGEVLCGVSPINCLSYAKWSHILNNTKLHTAWNKCVAI